MGIQQCLGILHDRCLLEIRGADASAFLQGLITTDIGAIKQNVMMAGALLSPQGKVLFDFLIGQVEDGDKPRFFIDSPANLGDNLVRRLSLYKLRSEVDIVFLGQKDVILSHASAANEQDKQESLAFLDGRLMNKQILRLYTDYPDAQENRQKWDEIRISHAVAESGADFLSGEVFPHDINFDEIGGLSFKKGCYIGQEVVSRMHHRGELRRRLLLASASAPLPASGTVIEAAGKPLGTIGSSTTTRTGFLGLALVRLDRVKAAQDGDREIICAGQVIQLEVFKRDQFSFE